MGERENRVVAEAGLDAGGTDHERSLLVDETARLKERVLVLERELISVRDAEKTTAAKLVHVREIVGRMQALVAVVGGGLTSVLSAELEGRIDAVLRMVAENCAASGAHILEFAPSQRASMTHVWHDDKVAVDARLMRDVPLPPLEWWLGRVKVGETVAVSERREIPASARALGALLDGQRVAGMLSVPLADSSGVVGALTLLRGPGLGAWGEADRELLRVVAALLGGVLRRRRVEDVRRAGEEQLLQAQRMEAIGRLAGGVAHDFNNLLTGILGYTDEALARAAPADPMREEIREIGEAAERAAELTRQLLAFSRKQIGRPKVLSIGEGIVAVQPRLKQLLGDDIDVVFTRSEDDWKVEIDPTHVEEILRNLSANARDAMPRGGTLVISTSQFVCRDCLDGPGAMGKGEYVALTVSDEGAGIAEELHSQIFEPFYTTKGHGQGKGLGLSTVYGLVRQSGGFIQVRSELGAGTTFSIFFPRSDGRSASAPPMPVDRGVPQGRETILLVEDDALVRGLAARVLRRQGYRVVEAGGGKEALAIALGQGLIFDLLLTDVMMPGMTGPELYEALQKERPRLTCLYMSGYAEDVIVHHGVTDADKTLLSKPFSAEKLARTVREMLDSAVVRALG